MDASKGNIFEILDGKRQFVVPVYQRYYSWDKSQCERLWDDIVNMQKQNKKGHFVGSIVNIAEKTPPTGVQKYMIIDGQQRMTTLTLLLIALRDYAKAHPSDTELNAEEIENTLLKNPYKKDDERYKLILTKQDKDALISLIEKTPTSNVKKLRVNKNYDFFVDMIENRDISLEEIYEAVGKLQIVNITLDRESDDAQLIFESLNSTGKELSESDLIRNYVLMKLDSEEQVNIYEHKWRPMEEKFNYQKEPIIMDRFFRDYLTMKLGKIANVNKVYDAFRTYHLSCSELTIENLCNDLLEFSTYYTDIIFAKNNDSNLRQIYEDINDLKMEVSYPFLLRVHKDFNEEVISYDEFLEILNLTVAYVFRRNICEIPTNSLNKTFATLKNFIDKDDYLSSIKAFFISQETYKRFPSDTEFAEAFKTKDIYNRSKIRNFVLSKIENHNNKSKVIIENHTIEHIMPQTENLCDAWKQALGENYSEIQQDYLHTIGNLTLTAYNSEMSDKPFLEKLNMEGGFLESALRLNKYVVKQDTWNKNKIEERADELLAVAFDIWEYPILEDEKLEKFCSKDKVSNEYSIDDYAFNEITTLLFELLNNRIMNLSSDVKKEYKKNYIAYKLDTNFVDIVVQSKGLRLTVNMKFDGVKDDYGICEDVTNLGRWGNGDVCLRFDNLDDIDKVMDIIKQSYDNKTE